MKSENTISFLKQGLAKDTSKLKSDEVLVDSRWTWLMSL